MPSPTQEQIERLAYQIWEMEGRPAGREREHYFEAERLLSQQAILAEQHLPSPTTPRVQRAPVARSKKASAAAKTTPTAKAEIAKPRTPRASTRTTKKNSPTTEES